MGAASGFVWRSMPQSGVLGGPLSCQHNAGSDHCRARHDHTAIHVPSASRHDGKICALDLASAVVARDGRCVDRSLAWAFCESISSSCATEEGAKVRRLLKQLSGFSTRPFLALSTLRFISASAFQRFIVPLQICECRHLLAQRGEDISY
jgi:hypothetical protein